MQEEAAEEPMQAVGPLLAFHCKAHETAFVQEFTTGRMRLDPASLTAALLLNAVTCLLPLHARGGLAAVATVAQSSYMALLLALVHWGPERYARHRSLLLSGALVWQAVVSELFNGADLRGHGRVCSSPLAWAAEELTVQLAPWSVMAAIALPLPLGHCLAAQAAVAAICIAGLERKRQLSALLCGLGVGRYRAASAAVNRLAGFAVPLGSAALHQQLDGPLAYYPASVCLQLAVTFVLPVVLAYRSAWHQRLAFARQRHLDAEAAGLVERWEQWGGASTLLPLALGALPWLAIQLCSLGLCLGLIPGS